MAGLQWSQEKNGRRKTGFPADDVMQGEEEMGSTRKFDHVVQSREGQYTIKWPLSKFCYAVEEFWALRWWRLGIVVISRTNISANTLRMKNCERVASADLKMFTFVFV